MSRVMVSSDLHLGHRNVTRWRKNFASVEEHDAHIIRTHVENLTKRDIWVCLGDVCFDKEKLHLLKQINCEKKILILGNHCTEYLSVWISWKFSMKSIHLKVVLIKVFVTGFLMHLYMSKNCVVV